MGCSLGCTGAAAVNSDVRYMHVYYGKETFGRFRDIGHGTYSLSTTVGTLKQQVVAEWPQGKTISPKSAGDVKLIHAGKVLENSKTLADCRITLGDVPGGVITMHVVVQPPVTKNKTDNNQEENQKMNSCSCTIL